MPLSSQDMLQEDSAPVLGTDFFRSQFGNYANLPFWRKRNFGILTDLAFDLRLRLNRSYRSMSSRASVIESRRILVVGVEVIGRSEDLRKVFSSLSSKLHHVTYLEAPMQEGLGKFQNINRVLSHVSLEQYEWLIVLDDDIAVPSNFLDQFLFLAENQKLRVCMPAHRFHSYLGFRITHRHWNSLSRETHFVECGPLTAFHRDTFSLCVPFPETRWAWGIDVLWSELARTHDLPIGIVDACALEHLRPVGKSYKRTCRPHRG